MAFKRIDYLDSLRGIAALVVLVSHFLIAYGLPTGWARALQGTPVSSLWDGFAAVSLFFVLSGFVLSLKRFAPKPANEEQSIAPFFVARIFRIGPPYVCAVVVSAFAMHFAFDMSSTFPPATEWVSQFWHHEISFRQVIRDAFLMEQVNERRLVPQGWTLAIEIKFSLMIPFLVLIAKRGLLWLSSFAAVCLAFLNVHYFLFHFALGVLLAERFSNRPELLNSLSRFSKAILLGFSLALYSANCWFTHAIQPERFTGIVFCISGLGAAGIIASCLSSASLQAMLSWKFPLLLGRVSYSFYLLHMIVIFCVTPKILRFLDWPHEFGTRAVALVVTVGVTLIFAVLFYWMVETPSAALGRKIGSMFSRSKQKFSETPITIH